MNKTIALQLLLYMRCLDLLFTNRHKIMTQINREKLLIIHSKLHLFHYIIFE